MIHRFLDSIRQWGSWSGHDPIRANLASRDAFRARCSGNCGEGKKIVAEYGLKT